MGFLTFCIVGFGCKENYRNTAIAFTKSEGIDNNYFFEKLGIQPGEYFPDLSFYSLEKQPLKMEKLLDQGKTLVFISGAYTCDVTHKQLQEINAFHEASPDSVSVFLIYTVEAHPFDSPSPYHPSDEVWLSDINLDEQIFAPQPKNLNERLDLANVWVNEQQISTPVLLDNAENSFWEASGQGPNMAVVLSPEGQVLFKQRWFDKSGLEEFMKHPVLP